MEKHGKLPFHLFYVCRFCCFFFFHFLDTGDKIVCIVCVCVFFLVVTCACRFRYIAKENVEKIIYKMRAELVTQQNQYKFISCSLLSVKVVQMCAVLWQIHLVLRFFSIKSNMQQIVSNNKLSIRCRFCKNVLVCQPYIYIYSSDCIVYVCHIRWNNTPNKQEQNKRTLETS